MCVKVACDDCAGSKRAGAGVPARKPWRASCAGGEMAEQGQWRAGGAGAHRIGER